MKEENPSRPSDIESFNRSLLEIDLDQLEVVELEDRLEFSLATFFDDLDGDLDNGDSPCAEFTCRVYVPPPVER